MYNANRLLETPIPSCDATVIEEDFVFAESDSDSDNEIDVRANQGPFDGENENNNDSIDDSTMDDNGALNNNDSTDGNLSDAIVPIEFVALENYDDGQSVETVVANGSSIGIKQELKTVQLGIADENAIQNVLNDEELFDNTTQNEENENENEHQDETIPQDNGNDSHDEEIGNNAENGRIENENGQQGEGNEKNVGNDADSDDEEIEFTVVSKGFPNPIQYDGDDLVKRENDSFSGNLPYSDKVRVNTD